jgi:hypothetical protein
MKTQRRVIPRKMLSQLDPSEIGTCLYKYYRYEKGNQAVTAITNGVISLFILMCLVYSHIVISMRPLKRTAFGDDILDSIELQISEPFPIF